MAMVLVTHDLGVVAGRTDEIAVMYGGRLVEKAKTTNLFAAMRHPYTHALLQSIQRVENASHTRAEGHPGSATRPGEPAEGLCVRAALRPCRRALPARTPGTGTGVPRGSRVPRASQADHQPLRNNSSTTSVTTHQAAALGAHPRAGEALQEYPHQLSGGMRQRVMIVVALAAGPLLIFADEPTTALDVTVQAQILDLLQAQQHERHMAMVLVTHDLGVVAGRTDEIAVMYGGRLVEKAKTTDLFAAMRHPYTHALLQSIPRVENASHTRLKVIPGRPPDLVNPPKGCAFAPRCDRADDRCLHERPVLEPAFREGHEYACFHPVPVGDPVVRR